MATTTPQVGSEWARRLRDTSPSQRVRIIEIRPTKTTFRALVELVDEDNRTEDVPGSQPRVPWAEVAAFNESMANWARIRTGELTETEQAAVEELFELMVPRAIADLHWSPEIMTEVSDPGGISTLLGTNCRVLLEAVETFDDDGPMWVSAEGTRLIAERICQHHAARVLGWVHEREQTRRHEALYGRQPQHHRDSGEDGDRVYDFYMRSERHTYELLRQWCGHRAIALDERIRAANDEIRRLDLLLLDAFTLLAKHDEDAARRLTNDHETQRIRPEDVRPMVERRSRTVFVQPQRRFWRG